ncbi:MAG TPA: type III PLP-dependent enzyme [Chloroflexota bacterium]|nr:type III PLP-dependent enzyme [Chloroflexota bacterium]
MAVTLPSSALMARLIERSASLATPFLLQDLDQVRRNLRRLREAFADAEIYYAVKANPHPDIVGVAADERCGFEISSDGELDLLMALPRVARIISSNPIKAPQFIRRASQSGVSEFAVDSGAEVAKVAREAPGASVFVRLLVDNTASEWPLARKYGVELDVAVGLLRQADRLGLRPIGTTFHVGSQCRSAASWEAALAVTAEVWRAASHHGIDLELLSVGGGFPVQHTRPIPTIEEIAEVVRRTVKVRFPAGVRVAMEPGRGIVGDAGLLGASVIGTAKRGDETWVYLDVGVFNGLMEAIDGFSYEVVTEARGMPTTVVLAGPSCDSLDVIAEKIDLPEVAVGDRVYFVNAGAYTLAYASHFNGWLPPTVYSIRDSN